GCGVLRIVADRAEKRMALVKTAGQFGSGPVMRAFEGCMAAFAAALVLLIQTTCVAQTLPGGFVYLRDVDPSILQDMRYASANNFTGRRLAGYEAGECVVKREVAQALSRVQQEVKAQGLSLKML